MPVDHIRYDLLAQDALRGVVRRVLSNAAKNGLPGDHHFFISFDTRARGVRISPRLREQHPEDMTIVLQHQFWDLTVTDQGFEVGLSFKGIAERVVVPFEAIKSFFDPSVQFGLQFEVAPESAAAGEETPSGEKPTPAPPREEAKPPKSRRPGRPKTVPSVAPAATPVPSKAADKTEQPPKAPEPSPGGAEVVSLDRFRKK
jgi:hypothetical protein